MYPVHYLGVMLVVVAATVSAQRLILFDQPLRRHHQPIERNMLVEPAQNIDKSGHSTTAEHKPIFASSYQKVSLDNGIRLRRSGEVYPRVSRDAASTHVSRDTPTSLYAAYKDLSYAASYNGDLSANHPMRHRDKRKVFKLRNVALPLSIFHYLGFLPMRIPGMPYHIDPGLPDYTPYEPYNKLGYKETPLRNRSVLRNRNAH